MLGVVSYNFHISGFAVFVIIMCCEFCIICRCDLKIRFYWVTSTLSDKAKKGSEIYDIKKA